MDLAAGGDDQEVIFEDAAALEQDSVLVRFNQIDF